MDRGDCLQCLLDKLLAQQLAECIEDDAIADAEEQMQRSGNDALWTDGKKSMLPSLVCPLPLSPPTAMKMGL